MLLEHLIPYQKGRSITHKEFNKIPKDPNTSKVAHTVILTLYTHSHLLSKSDNSPLSTFMANLIFLILFIISLQIFPPLAHSSLNHVKKCRSYCGNLTIDYPFGLQPGCGHPGFRDLLFCINDVLMFHITSGSYRVLDIDYAYKGLILHDPHMSNCDSLVLSGQANGFGLDSWRAQYLFPGPDNVFMLIGCSAMSPLFQGFPSKHLPCRNVSGLGCEEYYGCPAWDTIGPNKAGSLYGAAPPQCCAVPFESIKSINLTELECQGYSSAFSSAPLRLKGPNEWAYGIRVRYSLQGNGDFCKACEATGGMCGYETSVLKERCICGDWNSTSNCDSAIDSSSWGQTLYPTETVTGFSICMLIQVMLWSII